MVDVRTPDFPDVTAAREAYDAEYLPQVAAQHDDVQPVFSTEDFYEIVDHTTGLRQLIPISSVSAAAGANGGTASAVSSLIQFRRGTAAQWAAANPILSAGEPGLETDTGVVRIGNGSSAYLSLPAGIRTCKQTALATNSAVAAASDIPGMAFSVQSGHTYIVRWHIAFISAVATTGIAFRATGPTMTHGQWFGWTKNGSTGASMWWGNSSDTFGGLLSASQASSGTASAWPATLEGIFQPSADGTIQLRFQTEVDGSLVTVNNVGVGELIDCG